MLSTAALLCISVLAACNDGGTDDPDTTVPTAVSSSTSSTAVAAPDITVVPATIDEPYVNAVLAALDEIDGRATRMIVATKTVPEEALGLLRAILGNDEFLIESREWVDALARDPQGTGFHPNPGNRLTTVERILTRSPTCIWMAVQRDRSKVNIDPGPVRTEYVALERLEASNDPTRTNATPWAILVDGLAADGSEPANPCPTQ